MSDMSEKQMIYQELLKLSLVYLRNQAAGSWWQRLNDRSVYYETELIHNLPISMFRADFVEHDIWFLNVQARNYYDTCNAQLSPIYTQQIAYLIKLFGQVPDSMRSQLKWDGPKDANPLSIGMG
ncbi:hypothetical protein [Chitinimonas naiadis]